MRRGFTLLEVVVAVAILALATTLLVVASGRGLSRLADARAMEAASVAGERKLLELVKDGPPALEEETAWAPMEATTDLGFDVQWRKRIATIPVDPAQVAAQDPDTLRLLEVSIRLEAEEAAPVHRFSTLFPPPPAAP